MKICIAPDSFKECLSSTDVARAIAEGVRRACPRSTIDMIPIADGGEGTVEALVHATGGRVAEIPVAGPLGEPLSARYGLLGDGSTAVIEMAEASGLQLVPAERRNPMLTTTYGTGELIRAALDNGAKRIIIGIGGSATVDGGVGMAQALGARFASSTGNEIARGGGAISDLARIDLGNLDKRLRGVQIDVACDVDNPLTGPSGAAHIYGPQKGADAEMVAALDANLAIMAEIIRRDLGKDVEQIPGAGAAGGLGAGLVAFLNAHLRSGIDIVLDAVNFSERIQGCDLVITGEGRIDGQTARGKAPAGVARVAAVAGVPVIALAGSIGPGTEKLHEVGIAACFSILTAPMMLEDSIRNAAELLADGAEQAMRLFLIGRES